MQQQLPNLKLCSERSQLGYLVNLICDLSLSLSLSLSLFCQTLYIQGDLQILRVVVVITAPVNSTPGG
jgi:hypothetical protein